MSPKYVGKFLLHPLSDPISTKSDLIGAIFIFNFVLKVLAHFLSFKKNQSGVFCIISSNVFIPTSISMTSVKLFSNIGLDLLFIKRARLYYLITQIETAEKVLFALEKEGLGGIIERKSLLISLCRSARLDTNWLHRKLRLYLDSIIEY